MSHHLIPLYMSYYIYPPVAELIRLESNIVAKRLNGSFNEKALENGSI